MSRIGNAALVLLCSTACGASVRAQDADRAALDAITSSGPFDALDRDVSDDLADRGDGQDAARDANARRDARADAATADAATADAAECDEFNATVTCQRFYRIREGDYGAVFTCCNGRCESGSCLSRSEAGVPRCGSTPCDIRAGQLCCPNTDGCFPRDRMLCP